MSDTATQLPNHFPGVRGHAAAQAQLVRALARGQLHHALLVVGPRGVGKATLCRALARAIHCKVAPGIGCGTCVSCHRIDSDRHAGVEWIVPEDDGGKIKVEAARELATRLQLAPFEGDRHVVIFDPAEALTEQALNALLKTLEEPNAGVHFLLVATGLDAILPTILSRCATLRLGRLDDADVAQALTETLARRGDDAEPVPEARRELAARLADGSAGAAVELALDPALDRIADLVRAAVSAVAVGPAEIFAAGEQGELARAWAAATAGPTTGKPARERNATVRMTELWLLHLRELIRDRAPIPGIGDPFGSLAGWSRAADVLLELQGRIASNANAKLVLEQALLELGDVLAASQAGHARA